MPNYRGSIKDLRDLFYIAMRHFGHSPEAQKEAWAVARQHPYRAHRCYKAIANSLQERKP
jgi:hypothetical protein